MEKIQSGPKKIRGLKASAVFEEGVLRTKLNSGGIQAEGVRGGIHSVFSRKSRDAAGGEFQE